MEIQQNQTKIMLSDVAAKKIKNGYPLIHAEDLVQFNGKKDLKLFGQFVDIQGHYLGTGYLGKQNKGVGWILTKKKEEKIDQLFFERKFEEAKKHREAFFHSTHTTAFRCFNGEGDGIGGITIDLYQDFLVLTWYNETILMCKNDIIAALKKIFPEVKGAYEKYRFQSSIESQHLYGEAAPEPLLVLENNVTYATYLNEGLMTGIFLDQKEVRNFLLEEAAVGKKVLNTFSYTGAFSVAAAMGGALETTSVDLAKRSLPKTQEQFLVNGLDLERQKIIVMDIFEFFRYAIRKGFQYDIVILDPPSFARNKKQVFSVAKNYHELVENAVKLLNPGGLLIASTNAANLSCAQFKGLIQKGMDNAGFSGKMIRSFQLPPDFRVDDHFPEGNYLKVYCYEIQK